MHTVDDAKSPNSAEYDHNSSAVRRNINLKEAVNPPGRRSNGDSRIMVRFKLSSSSVSAMEVGSVEKVSAGDDEKIAASTEQLNNKSESVITPVNSKSEQETACNTPPQHAISIPECIKKSTRLRRNCEKAERAKFFVSLSRYEIEQDFIAITGKKPPGKPKKRPKVVQNRIDDLVPCQCLTEVHADHYK